jgi:hypothetical protein
MNASPSVRERPEGALGRQLASTDSESKSVTGHRIDEARSVAREDKTVNGLPRHVDRQRAEHDRRPDSDRALEPVAEKGLPRNNTSHK